MKVKVYGLRPRNMWFPILSWGIRWIQDKPYSHIGFKVEEVTSQVMDMTSKGCHLNNDRQFFEHYEAVIEWTLDLPITYNQFWLFYGKQANKEYAYWQNVGYLLRALGLMKCNPLGDGDRKLVCSELCAIFLKEFGIDIGDCDNYDLVQIELLLNKICAVRINLI